MALPWQMSFLVIENYEVFVWVMSVLPIFSCGWLRTVYILVHLLKSWQLLETGLIKFSFSAALIYQTFLVFTAYAD